MTEREKERCDGCHHLWRLHYLRRDGTSCGHCKGVPVGEILHRTEKTGYPCKGCGHFECLHFLSGLCRMVGCDCTRYLK